MGQVVYDDDFIHDGSSDVFALVLGHRIPCRLTTTEGEHDHNRGTVPIVMADIDATLARNVSDAEACMHAFDQRHDSWIARVCGLPRPLANLIAAFAFQDNQPPPVLWLERGDVYLKIQWSYEDAGEITFLNSHFIVRRQGIGS